MRNTVREGCLAIRVDENTLLAVPPMHPRTPSWVRVQVFEYVLRRQVGLAQMLAEAARDEVTGVTPERARLAQMLGETPHRNQRGMAAAA